MMSLTLRFTSHSVHHQQLAAGGKQLAVCLLLLLFQLFIGVSFRTHCVFAQSGSEGTLAQRYNEARFYFNQLLTSETISGEIENWQKGAQNFRRIYLADPLSEQAPACLFMLGRVYHQMYQRFQIVAYADESITYFKDTATLFPEHRLADDAYYVMGMLYLQIKQDPALAATQFAKIVQDYQSGDMHPQAAEMIKQLSKDHDIPLPPVMVGNSQLSKLNSILPAKYWSSNDYVRVVIMASGPVSYREELLESSPNNLQRLYIDFQDSYIEPQYRQPLNIENGLLQEIRTVQFSKDTVRFSLDVKNIDSYKIYSLPEPFRVVIDIRGKEGQSGQKKLARFRPAETTSSTESTTALVILQDQKKVPVNRQNDHVIKITRRQPGSPPPDISALSLAQQLGLKVRRIVLDPGHGGKDPGAMANGLQEKDIVLKFAQLIKPLLEQHIGCEVVLTRDSDTFISLEERTAIANTRNADLFLSLHVNAHPSPKVRGLETYYLNLSTNAEAMRVAAMENATSTSQISDLQDILQDILQNSKITESSRLAEQVHGALAKGSAGNTSIASENLGIKQAPFYVLIGAQMPAILVELAFVSNKQDALNLQSDTYLSAAAGEMVNGILAYVNSTTASL